VPVTACGCRPYAGFRRTGSTAGAVQLVAPGPAGRLAGAVTRSGRQICQRRSRCRTYAGSSAARIYGRHADCRIHVGRHSSRPRSGTQDYRPAASGLRVRPLRHLRCRQCRAMESTAVGTFRHGDGRRRFFRCTNVVWVRWKGSNMINIIRINFSIFHILRLR
jgi:hypothetical protein